MPAHGPAVRHSSVDPARRDLTAVSGDRGRLRFVERGACAGRRERQERALHVRRRGTSALGQSTCCLWRTGPLARSAVSWPASGRRSGMPATSASYIAMAVWA